MKNLYNAVFFTLLLGGIYFLIFHAHLPVISGTQAVAFGLSAAFVWVEVMKWGSVKPFTCMRCMTGWLTFLIAWLFHVPCFYLYLPLGLFVGSMFTVIQQRWL